MARFNVSGFRSTTTREFTGDRGEPLSAISNFEEEMPDADGNVIKRAVYEWRRMADGVFHQAGEKEPTVQCGCCVRGRPASRFRPAEAPTTGILLQAHAARCAREGCQRWLCAKHQRTDLAGRVVCWDHAPLWLWRILDWLFFSRIEG